ncbi:MAG: hypothetical protein J7452_00405 [Thermoflexus sp.]|jgi:hypothetical protein|nr:hypothetical protein [Thermoflexus sp.]
MADPLPRPIGLDWEALWAPYEEEAYHWILERLQPEERVLEIGAGDLRLAMQMVEAGAWVVAVERQWALLAQGLQTLGLSPGGLRWEHPIRFLNGRLLLVWADARTWPFPSVDAAVLLMRHCASFPIYIRKLRAAGCRRLFTNARWRMGVEEIDLGPARSFEEIPPGWYACRCGAVGFREGPPEAIDAAALERVWEVEKCPACHRPDRKEEPEPSDHAGSGS